MATALLLILLASAVASFPLEHPPLVSSAFPSAVLGVSNATNHNVGFVASHTVGSNTNSTKNSAHNQTVAYVQPILDLKSNTEKLNHTYVFNTNSTTKDDRNQTTAQYLPKNETRSYTHNMNHTIGSNTNSTKNMAHNKTVAHIRPTLELISYTDKMNHTFVFNTNSTTKDDRNQTVAQPLPKLDIANYTHGLNDSIDFSRNLTSNLKLNTQILHAIRKREVPFFTQLRVPAEEIDGVQGRQSQGNEKTPAKCRYYCFHPTGQFYCCEFAPIKSLKRGECPKIRPYCPQAFGRSALPERCVEDDFCPGPDKCCFDRCFNTHVCKTPVKVFDKP